MKPASLTISPWGNSYGIRLSRELISLLGITPGTPLEATVLGKGCLQLWVAETRLSLADKLATFDPAVHGGEAMRDAPRGGEFGSAS